MPYLHFWTSVILSGAQPSPRPHYEVSRMPWTAFTTIDSFFRRPGSENLGRKDSIFHDSTHSNIILNTSSHLALRMACVLRSWNRCTSVPSRNPGEDPAVSSHWNRFYLSTNASASSPLSEDPLNSVACCEMAATCLH